ncbi:MAG: hypothetical protein IIZ54_12325, partial [Selenomonadaceae bacterium]|nr:hypothetical protein [Selenomonadaceae bacterium]
QGMIRDMSTVAADQTRSEADRKDAAKVRNRYSSYAKSLRAIIGGNEGTELFGANRKIAQNAAEWIKAVREAQVDARNEDGTVRTDENGRRIKVRNGIDNTAYKRAVDAANFLGSCLGFRIRDFDTGERGAEPTYVWTGVHDRPSLTFQDVETFRRHRAELQSSNGNQGAPAAATPTSAPPPATETSTPPSAAEPASPPPPPPAPQAAPAAEPTASAPTSAPAPTPPAQPSAPAHRNFGAVANAAQRLGGQASSALARGILDRIRQRAERRRNNS